MLRNYFKIAFRGLLRNKSYTIINVVGLGLGITTCLIIFLIIHREFSFDNFHKDGDRIYRVIRETKTSSGVNKSNVTPYPAGTGFRNDFTDIKDITQIHFQEQNTLTINGEMSNVRNFIFADSSFFDVFGFEALSGNPKKDLAQPGRVFLTEEFVNTLPDKNIKHFRLGKEMELEVAGIIKTPPSPSHIAFNMIVSWPSLNKEFLGFPMDQWGLSANAFTYFKLPNNLTKEQVEKRFPAFINKYHSAEDATRETYKLQSLSAIHFDTEYTGNPGTSSTRSSTIYVLGFIGLFILVIACVNFINLSTALSIKKSKEVGVRKTLGAQQGQLAIQYLSEAFLLTCFAALLSIGITEVLAPITGSFLQKNIELNFIHNTPVILFLLGVVVFTSVFSGVYPSIVLSRFNPVKALKNRVSDPGSASSTLRKSLVVLQFFIAQVLIICTLVVSSQISYFRNKSLGFKKDAIINVYLPESNPEIVEALRNKLSTNPRIQDISMSVGAPISDNVFGTRMYLPEKGKEEQYNINLKPADIHYKDVYGLELVAGRWFEESEEKMASLPDRSQRRYAYIITEATAKDLGYASPKDVIGKQISTGLNSISAPIVGVLKDFNTSSLRDKIASVVFIPYPSFYYDAGIKVSTEDMPGTIKFIEQAWQQAYPQYLFQYTFLDQYVGKLYAEEERMFIMFEIFAGIAILIGCLGLYGLASFMANQKTKEVAIRKTLGASVSQIVMLFSKEFIVLVVVAFAFAVPVAWYAMHQWLETFAYKVDMGVTVFLSGIVFTMVIAFTTVGYRSLRAAVSNPVNALKSE